MRLLDDRPRLSAAITVLMAVAVLVMAWGSDPTSSARAAVGDATGPLIADSLTGGAVLDARNMGPGDSAVGEVTVTNVGDQGGDMALGTSDLADSTARGGVLSQILQLSVLDVTPGRQPAVVFTGRIADLHAALLGDFEQGDAHRYRFTVTYPTGLAPALDDSLQGASTRVNFLWTATGNGKGGTGNGNVDVTPVDPNPVIVDHVEPSKNPAYLKLRVYVRRRQAAHRKQVYVNVYCSHHCTVVATGLISLPSQKRHWTMKALKGSVKKPGTVKFRLPLARKALGRLNRALLHHRQASIKLKITARSGTEIVHWTRTIRLDR